MRTSVLALSAALALAGVACDRARNNPLDPRSEVIPESESQTAARPAAAAPGGAVVAAAAKPAAAPAPVSAGR